MLRRVLFLGLMISCILGLTMAGTAQAALINNGNFETCDLTGWSTWAFGDVGVDVPPFAINGLCSGFVNTNSAFSVGGVCSWVMSDAVHPTFVPQALKVTFKVRYSTNEPFIFTAAKDDPFHAMLKFEEGGGDMTIATVTSTGVSAAPGFSVTDLTTGTVLASPRAEPTFVAGFFPGWNQTTHIMQVTGSIPYTNCGFVHIRFDICNGHDTLDDSFAQVDDVDFTFVNAPGTATTWWKFPPNVPVLCP